MGIGETGQISENTTFTGEPIVITFTEPLTDPVISLTSTNFGGNKFALRVIDIQTNAAGDATGFRFTIDEWENHDGRHPAVEDINWLAIETGVHTLADGRIIEAGYADADSDGEAVSFTAPFTAPPVVLTTVASDNHTSVVDSDPSAVTSTGFTASVQEAESQDGVHALESVGYIAIQAGGDGTSGTASTAGGLDSGWNTFSLGATYTNPIVQAETQTLNDPDPGSIEWRNLDPDEIDMRFEEDTSVDGDSGHAEETVGIVTFEEGIILCFDPRALIDTPKGPVAAGALRPGDLVRTRDTGAAPLTWVCRKSLLPDDLANPDRAPVCIAKDSIAPGVPARDLWVSPQHRILIEGWMAQLHFGEAEVFVPAKVLAKPAPEHDAPKEYVHLLLDRHEVLWAEGAPSESLYPAQIDKATMDPLAREELFKMLPDLRSGLNQIKLARPSVTVRDAQSLLV